MDHSTIQIYTLGYLLSLFSTTTGTQETIIRKHDGLIQEYSSVVFNCSTSVNWSPGGLRWSFYLTNGSIYKRDLYTVTDDGDCELFSDEHLPDSSIRCSNRTRFSLTLRNVTRLFHGMKVRCEVYDDASSTSSQNMSIQVEVPVSRASIVEQEPNFIRTNENNATDVTCRTSLSFPGANITWYLGDKTITNNVTMEKGKRDEFIVTQSILKLVPARKMNGSQIYCSASNGVGDSPVVNSMKFTILVYYSPSKPTLHINGTQVNSSVDIIKGNVLRLRCRSDGYPEPTYKWEHNNEILKHERNLVLEEIDNGSYTCFVSNQLHWANIGMNNYTVSVRILIPVQRPVLYLNNSHQPISGSIDVIENDTFTILCRSSGNPPPRYRWNNGVKGKKLEKISVRDDFNNTCVASNKLVETVGETKESRESVQVFVTVLYPPRLPRLQVLHNSEKYKDIVKDKVTIKEFETFKLKCSADSRPASNYSWSKEGTLVENSDIFEMFNVSRHDAGTFSCKASNEMTSTFRGVVDGMSTRHVSLNVLYAAKVTKFNVSARGDDRIAITEQRQNVTLQCRVDSNPGSNINISFNDNLLASGKDVQTLTHSLINVSCHNAGVYICSTFNKHNRGVASTRQLELYVRCPPRPESHQNGFNITTLKYVPATLRFTAKNHLALEATQFKWQRLIYNSDWKSLQNGEHNILISTQHLQTNLTVTNVTQIYIGLYRVVYNNSAGGNEQLFHLNIGDVPDPPTNFSHVSLKVTEVIVSWTKGFNGGLQQTFILQFNKTRLDEFVNISVLETDDKETQHSVIGLVGGTVYKMVLWSKNDLGISNHSQILIVRTKDIEDQTTDFSLWIGLVLSLLAILAIVLGIYLYKRTSSQDNTELKYWNTLANTVLGKRYKVNKKARRRSPEQLRYENIPFTSITDHARRNEAVSSQENAEPEKRLVYENLPYIHSVKQAAESSNSKGEERCSKIMSPLPAINETPFQGQGLNDYTVNEQHERRRTLLQPGERVAIQLEELYDEPTEYCNSPERIEQIYKISVSELLAYVSGRSKESFANDFKKLPFGLHRPCTFARKPNNIALNRYNGIYPYDHSRVTISGEPDFFINACYIDGYKRSKEYIASLGPTVKTTEGFRSFWEMVWNEHSDVIIMLTNLNEPSGMKCEQYWPEVNATLVCGNIQIASKCEEVFAEYTVRSFIVYHGNSQRTVTHLHFTAWPDKNVPEDVTSLIEFREQVKATPSIHKGPLIVHCSAGIGRTGTLIAIDRLIEEGKCARSVNVLECVHSMREQRVNMVQTCEQFIYIYKALVDSLYFDYDPVSANSFHDYVEEDDTSKYRQQFKQLGESDLIKNSGVALETVSASGNKDENPGHGTNILGREHQVYLYMNRQIQQSEYIDATYINSFKRKDHFIISKSPTHEEIWNFLCMVYQENCYCVVTLDDPNDAVGCYLPSDNRTLQVKNISVSSKVFERKHHFVTRELKIINTEKNECYGKQVFHFEYKHWNAGKDTPVDVNEFVQFINEVEEFAEQLTDPETSHVLVHCSQLYERSALFCIIAILREKIRYEGKASIPNTIKHIRTRRKSALTSVEQLRFCYQAVSDYMCTLDSMGGH